MGFTVHRSFKLEKGLYLEERKGAAFYKARSSIKGHTAFFNTEETDYARAERQARSWFKRLKSAESNQNVEHKTLGEVARSFLNDLSKPITKENHTKKWNGIREFFQSESYRVSQRAVDVSQATAACS